MPEMSITTALTIRENVHASRLTQSTEHGRTRYLRDMPDMHTMYVNTWTTRNEGVR